MHAANLNSKGYETSVYARDSSKLHPSVYRSVTEIVYKQEMQRVDRELHLELAESPINPAFIHMSSPIQNGCDPLFYLKTNGEALWKWREWKMDPTQLFA